MKISFCIHNAIPINISICEIPRKIMVQIPTQDL